MQDCNGAQCNTGKADIISNKCRFPELRGRGSPPPMTGEIFKSARLCFLKPQTAFYFIYFARVGIDCFLISSRQPELLRLHLQLYSAWLNFFVEGVGGGGEVGGK